MIGNDCIGRYKSNYHTITNYGYNKKYFRFICGGNGSIQKKLAIGTLDTGADLGGGAHPARPAPPKIGKKYDFWRKIVIFHTKYPKHFRASLRSRKFFKCAPPNMKSWIRPCDIIKLVSSTPSLTLKVDCTDKSKYGRITNAL